MERANPLIALGGRECAPVDNRRPPQRLHPLLDQLDRRAVIAEDHDPVGRLLQDFGEHVELGVRGDFARAFGELARDRAMLGLDALPFGQMRERFRQRLGRGAQPLAQMNHRELDHPLAGPLPSAAHFRLPLIVLVLHEALAIQPAQELGGALVEVGFRLGQLDLGMAGTAGWQVQVVDHARAARADHDRVSERAQGLGVFGLAGIAAYQVCGAEFLPRAELPGAEQGDEVVQLAQVVLQRRRREQQDKIALDLLDELVRRAAVALDLVRLVHDHEVPMVPQNLFGVAAGARAVVRHDRAGDALPVVGIGRGVEVLKELLLQLALPLPHQRCRREDERAAGQAANRQLPVDDARLDRLAEPDFVGEDRAAAHLPQHALGNVDLVRQLLDGVGAQRDEPVEARDERDVLRLAPQLVPGARRGRSVELPGKEVQRAFVDRPHRDSCIGHLPQREEGPQYSIRDCTAPASTPLRVCSADAVLKDSACRAQALACENTKAGERLLLGFLDVAKGYTANVFRTPAAYTFHGTTLRSRGNHVAWAPTRYRSLGDLLSTIWSTRRATCSGGIPLAKD